MADECIGEVGTFAQVPKSRANGALVLDNNVAAIGEALEDGSNVVGSDPVSARENPVGLNEHDGRDESRFAWSKALEQPCGDLRLDRVILHQVPNNNVGVQPDHWSSTPLTMASSISPRVKAGPEYFTAPASAAAEW